MIRLRVPLAGLALAALLSGASPALAQTPPAPAPVMPAQVEARVGVSLMVLLASEQAGESDPRLASWMPLLRTTPFQSFQMLDAHEMALADSEEHGLRLSEGRRIRLQLLSHDLTQARLKVVLESGEEKVVDTTITVARNKSFFLAVRGPQGTSLLLPIVVRY